VYGQIGPEPRFDPQENNAFGGPKLSESDEVKIGITPGVGIFLNISGISLGAHLTTISCEILLSITG
jgi:hypothetical protein